jgi:hypothetical protein
LTNDRTIYERAYIYHDSSAVAFFGGQLKDLNEAAFAGTEYRVSEITGALLNVQLDRLDGLLADLRERKAAVASALAGKARFIPSNDAAGDCGTTLAFRFDSITEATRFAESAGGRRPIDTGKHVYTNWEPILKKKGAVNPAFDPFLMEANKKLNHRYTADMCARTLDYLARTVYVDVEPDWTEKQVAEKTAALKAEL